MPRILLINPNTSQATTDMMVAIARSVAPSDWQVEGATATLGPPMIVDPAALLASAREVVEIGVRRAPDVSGIIVSAFGDPGVASLRAMIDVPVVGIAEASMLEAADGGRRFGVATTSAALEGSIAEKANELGLDGLYAGSQITVGDPAWLVTDADRLVAALADAIERCITRDQAKAVVIGGGPLGDAATVLASRLNVPVIAPIPAAVRRLVGLLG